MGSVVGVGELGVAAHTWRGGRCGQEAQLWARRTDSGRGNHRWRAEQKRSPARAEAEIGAGRPGGRPDGVCVLGRAQRGFIRREPEDFSKLLMREDSHFK